jgi:hypothetical protein
MQNNTKKKTDKRKFVIIAKVSNDNFVKYRTNNIDNTILFIKNKYPDFRFANIFSKIGINKGLLLYTYGKIKGLQNAY